MDRILSDKTRNILRGKTLAGHITKDEILSVFGHIDAVEEWLDETENDPDGPGDIFGTEGWRHCLGLD